MADKETLGQRIIRKWVEFRTSYIYLWLFLMFCLIWIGLNRLFGILDNPELTELNLILSIMTEVNAIILMVYLLRISDRDKEADKRDKDNMTRILKKLDKIYAEVEEDE